MRNQVKISAAHAWSKALELSQDAVQHALSHSMKRPGERVASNLVRCFTEEGKVTIWGLQKGAHNLLEVFIFISAHHVSNAGTHQL